MATIVYLSSLPSEKVPGGWFPNFDKLLHVCAFGAGTLLLLGALQLTFRWTPRRIALVAVTAIGLFGITDEWHQLSTPNRSGADPFDLAADVVGAILAAVVFYVVRTKSNFAPREDRAADPAD
jgi:VanZ family protein